MCVSDISIVLLILKADYINRRQPYRVYARFAGWTSIHLACNLCACECVMCSECWHKNKTHNPIAGEHIRRDRSIDLTLERVCVLFPFFFSSSWLVFARIYSAIQRGKSLVRSLVSFFIVQWYHRKIDDEHAFGTQVFVQLCNLLRIIRNLEAVINRPRLWTRSSANFGRSNVNSFVDDSRHGIYVSAREVTK